MVRRRGGSRVETAAFERVVRPRLVEIGRYTPSRRAAHPAFRAERDRMLDLEASGPYLLVVLAGIFLIWYFVGAALTRRRLAAAATWVNRGLDVYRQAEPERTRASIKWLSTNAFNIALESARPPCSEVVATVLLQSRDMVTMWLIDRVTGRRDLLMLRFDLDRQPIWGVELFRRRSVLAGEATRLVKREGWRVEPTADRGTLAAHGGGKASDLCHELLEILGEERRRLVRLSVRRQSPHLTLALDLPDPASSDPLATMRLGERLVAVTLDYSTR